MWKIKCNKGNGVIILGLSLVGLILLAGIFIVDIGKAMFMKNLYSSYARKAVQVGVKYQDSIGGLSPESAAAVINEYKAQRIANGKGNTNESAYSTSCDASGEYPKIEISYDNKRAKDSSSGIYESTHYSLPVMRNKADFFRNQYNTIQVRITDVTDNYFFGMFGTPCAKINIQASGITTTSFDEDAIEINK